jgi:hypothetical protein
MDGRQDHKRRLQYIGCIKPAAEPDLKDPDLDAFSGKDPNGKKSKDFEIGQYPKAWGQRTGLQTLPDL